MARQNQKKTYFASIKKKINGTRRFTGGILSKEGVGCFFFQKYRVLYYIFKILLREASYLVTLAKARLLLKTANSDNVVPSFVMFAAPEDQKVLTQVSGNVPQGVEQPINDSPLDTEQPHSQTEQQNTGYNEFCIESVIYGDVSSVQEDEFQVNGHTTHCYDHVSCIPGKRISQNDQNDYCAEKLLRDDCPSLSYKVIRRYGCRFEIDEENEHDDYLHKCVNVIHRPPHQ